MCECSIYCGKCKKHTLSDNMLFGYTKNGRRLLRCNCVRCGGNKARLVGGSFFKSIKNKLKGVISPDMFVKISNYFRKSVPGTRQLLPGEIHYLNHNFTGPGTRVDIPYVRDFKPYNEIDNCSRTHDIEYSEIDNIKDKVERQKAIRQADIRAVNCYRKYPNQQGYNAGISGMNNKMRIEDIAPSLIEKTLGDAYIGRK